ncbi:MAG: hypothetical protein ABIG68_08885 [Acidobacteriota bacterium]
MKRIIFPAAALAVLLLLTMSLVAHPHFNKTVTAKLPSGVDATITYNTTPANESHVTKAAVGSFLNPRRPMLKLAGELKAGSVTIPAGDYIIGVIKISENDFTMALYPGQIPRGESADMSKMIKLESMFTTSAGKAAHMLIDITPGSDKFEGRAVLTLHFGSLFLAGALS